MWRRVFGLPSPELCARFGAPPLKFDGSAAALLRRFVQDGNACMQYIRDGEFHYTDLPLGMILEAFASAYPGFGTERATVDGPMFLA
jgi:hypothetical protein